MDVEKLSKILDIRKMPDYLSQVEKLMKNVVSDANPSIRNPVLRIMQKRGKGIRPALLIAISLLGEKGVSKKTLDCCVAVELLHVAALIHDDVIDNGDTRRGQPTINALEGPDRSIIVGDYLMSLSFKLALRVDNQTATLLNETYLAMCDGQSLEMADQFNLDRTLDSYLEATSKKTASLLMLCCKLGGLQGGLPSVETNAWAKYGYNFGMAFQLNDDLLDLVSNEEVMGKPTGNDIPRGVYTMPVLLSLQGSSKQQIKKLFKDASGAPHSNRSFLEFLSNDGSIQKTGDEARNYSDKAVAALKNLENNPTTDGLKQLPSYYLNWSIAKQNIA